MYVHNKAEKLMSINTVFHISGKALCMLTKEDFCQRVPDLGDVLYNTLRGLMNQPLEGIGEAYALTVSLTRAKA